jgi:mitochondrial fission protein ELM1
MVSEAEVSIWCLLGKKAGDNTQVLALARALGYGYQEKHIRARPWELLTHLTMAPSLAGIDRAASSELAAPWPDLVISAGRRNEQVARWIRLQAGRAGKTTLLVHMGRPWAPLGEWDLLITTPQYFLPRQPNILHNSLPLHAMAADELTAAGKRLQEHLPALPRPRIAVLVGGDSGRFVFTPAKARQLGVLASRLANACSGALLVTDSPRTPRAAGDALQAALAAPHYCHRWGDPGDNPYRGVLALADAFIVTGESMSMLGEAAVMGKPLFIFDVGDGDKPWWRLAHSYRYKPLSHRFAMRYGSQRMRRDIGNIQAALVDGGRASWLQADLIDTAGCALAAASQGQQEGLEQSVAAQELERAAGAVRQLLISR